MPIKVEVLRRRTLNGTIDGHDPLVVTFRLTGGLNPFRLTVVTVNWGRGYDPGEFKQNVLNVLNHVGEREYVVLLIQELDEADAAEEHEVFLRHMEKGTTLVGWGTREPIAVSPGVPVRRKRKTLLMAQGTDIGAPEGTGPDRFFVSCIGVFEGVKIGFGNQHPHRNIQHAKVQAARRRGERVTREEIHALVKVCDLVIHGGDMNDANYPESHPRERVAMERGLDTLRYINASKS